MTQITETTFAPAIISVEGKTVTERRLSVLNTASAQAQLALVSAGGKVGKAAAFRAAHIGLVQIWHAASKANYRPMAEFLAGRTGKPMVISNRASFEALPDLFEASIMSAHGKKSGGYTVDKKTGALKPNAELSLAMELKAVCVEAIGQANALFAERQAERAKNATALSV